MKTQDLAIRIIAVLACSAAPAEAANVTRLKFSGGGRPAVINANATVVAGATVFEGKDLAARWAPAHYHDMEPMLLPEPPEGASQMSVSDIDATGCRIVGTATIDNCGTPKQVAYIWRPSLDALDAAGRTQLLGTLPGGEWSYASAISADGRVVTGVSDSSSGERAFIWTEGWGMQSLGSLEPGWSSAGVDVSANGAVIVGSSGPRAFRWTPTDGMWDLGISHEYFNVGAGSVSEDGTVIFGYGRDDDDGGLFRWTQATGMMALPQVQDVYKVSANFDGSRVIGGGEVWQANQGTSRVTARQFLVQKGIDEYRLGSTVRILDQTPSGRHLIVTTWNEGDDELDYLLVTLDEWVPVMSRPSGLSATDGTSTTTVIVKWTAVAGARRYEVTRTRVGAGNPISDALTFNVNAGITTIHDSQAVPGIRYAYSVSAVNDLGRSLASLTDEGWRNVGPPTGFGASDGTSATHVQLQWLSVAGATGYRVLRTLPGGSQTQIALLDGKSTTTFLDTSTAPGIVAIYQLQARTALGLSTLGDPEVGWRNAAPPATVTATDGTRTDGVDVSWGAVAGASGYKVFRAVGTAAPTQVGTTSPSVRTFIDAAASPGTKFRYTVRAKMPAGDTAASAADEGWRNVAPPSGLGASDGTFSTHVHLTWTAHPQPEVTGYRVLRKIGTASEVILATVSGRTTVTLSDFSIAVGATGTYRIAALTAAGPSEPSAANTGFRKAGSGAGMPTPGSGSASGTPGNASVTAAAPGSTPAGAAPSARSTAAPGCAASQAPSHASPSATGSAVYFSAADVPTCDELRRRIERLKSVAADAEAAGWLAALLDAPSDGLPSQARTPVNDVPAPEAERCIACMMLRGDIDLDGFVDAIDLVAWSTAWTDNDLRTGDVDRDGQVDHRDLLLLTAVIGRGLN